MKPRAAAGITLAGLMTACATAASPVDLAIIGVTGIRDMGCDLELVRWVRPSCPHRRDCRGTRVDVKSS